MDADHVALPEQRVEVDRLGAGNLPRQGVREDDAGAETCQPPRYRGTHVAESDDPDREVAKLVAGMRPVPAAFAQVSVQERGVPEQVQDHQDGQVGDRLLVVAGRIRHRDSVLGGGPVIDGVEADRGLLNQLAIAHVLQHTPIDAVLVPLVGDHQVRLVHRLQDRVLARWLRHQLDVHLVPALEETADGRLVERTQAGHAGGHAGEATKLACGLAAGPSRLC